MPMSCEVPCIIVPQVDIDTVSINAAPKRVTERIISFANGDWKEFRYVTQHSTRRTHSPARDTPSAEIHPSTKIESRRPHGVATVVRDGRAVHCGGGEHPVLEEQTGVECDAAIEEVLHAAAFVGHAVGRSNGRCIDMHPDRTYRSTPSIRGYVTLPSCRTRRSLETERRSSHLM